MPTAFKMATVIATVIVTLAYFLHITTFYFIVKWVPKIVVDLGFAASSAAGVLVWTNVGGALGGAVLGLLTQRYSVKALTIGVLFASTVMVTLFGRTPADLERLSIICGLDGAMLIARPYGDVDRFESAATRLIASVAGAGARAPSPRERRAT